MADDGEREKRHLAPLRSVRSSFLGPADARKEHMEYFFGKEDDPQRRVVTEAKRGDAREARKQGLCNCVVL